MDLNDQIDQDAPCDCVRYPHMRARECTGMIPAGERHYSRQGGSLDVNPKNWDDSRNRPRTCVHCVRHYNWKQQKDKPILVRVELTYSDGSGRILDGEAALDWEEAAGSQAVMSFVHGMSFPELPWREK